MMTGKPNLILLHGALGSSAQFEELKALLSVDYEVHSLDFSGHGGMQMDDDENEFSIEMFTDDVLDYVEMFAIMRTAIFGYSMGGYVALNFARKYPNWVTEVYTLATKFDWTPEGAAKEQKMLNPEKMEAKVPKFAATLNERHTALDWKVVVNNTSKMIHDLGNGGALKISDFAEIKKSVVIGVGDVDKMVTREESAAVADVLENGRLLVLEETGHPIEWVDTKALVKAFGLM